MFRKTATYLVYHSLALKEISGSIWTFPPVCVGGCDAPLRTFTDMTNEDDEQMRIVFEDGASEECSPADQRQISTAAVFHPAQRIPKHLKRVWDNPPTYANLVVVRCSFIVPDHYVMTDAGLKRVVSVQR